MSKYAIKKRQGVERNHAKHPKYGIAWCKLCQNRKGIK